MTRYASYRSRHVIEPFEVMHSDFGVIHRCAVDGIRVHPYGTRWYHDTDEVTALTSAETGGPWGGPDDHSLEEAMAKLVVSRRNIDTVMDRLTVAMGGRVGQPLSPEVERRIERLVASIDIDEDDPPERNPEGDPTLNGAWTR